MKRKEYIAPMSEVILCENLCDSTLDETLPVHWSQAGPGDVGAKEMDFDDDYVWGDLWADEASKE
ncbi:MAG: hypothetical protein IK067_03140 [Prevotella sp.]|nr:hypothetical protein [Prevotella sp.]